MIDEIEGFLQDRREAKHNWEVTGVNEMLTQMEVFCWNIYRLNQFTG